MAEILDGAEVFLSENYIYLKFIHMLFAMIWVWSTSVAYVNYVVPAFRRWQGRPGDVDAIQLRNWAMERFDKGARMEHVAFPILLLTGPMLVFAGGWDMTDGWLAAKLVLIVLLFIPVEVCDYWLAHFGGNKEALRLAGDMEGYEVNMHRHWWFLVITTPMISTFAIGVLFLAIVKPF